MNPPYPPYLIEADGHFYPYNDETLARIHVIENTRMHMPPDAVYRLEPDGFGFRYSEIDAIQFVKPEPVEIPVQTIELVA